MGSGALPDSSTLRDAVNRDRFAVINAAGEQLVNGTFTGSSTITSPLQGGSVRVTALRAVSRSFTVAGMTDAAAAIVAANADRIGGFFVNDDAANTVWVGPTAGVTTGTGIPVLPGASFPLGGASYIDAGALFGICGAGLTADLRIVEYSDV